MFIDSLIRRLRLSNELANIEGNVEVQACLAGVEAEKEALVENFNQIYESVAKVDAELADAREELL